jgi:spore photoproduct lyase
MIEQKTKTIKCKENGRSADATSAHFILGCRDKNNNPFCQYCYVDRFNRKDVYKNLNTQQILNECDKWVRTKPLIKKPNQVHDSLYLVDIGCDVDVNRYFRQYNWIEVFDWFKNHERLGATFATKWHNSDLLNYDSQKKIRIRYSLMPENIRCLVERGTSPILQRIKGSQKMFEAGWEVHYNLSPVIITPTWKQDYKELFKIINNEVSQNFKQQCGLEIIFLTHNRNLHNKNLERSWDESLLWNEEIQEQKESDYGGINVRYKWEWKKELEQEMKHIVEDLKIKIRYIF